MAATPPPQYDSFLRLLKQKAVKGVSSSTRFLESRVSARFLEGRVMGETKAFKVTIGHPECSAGSVEKSIGDFTQVRPEYFYDWFSVGRDIPTASKQIHIGGVAMTEQQRYQIEQHSLETENNQVNVFSATAHVHGCDLDKIDLARPDHVDQELSETLADSLKEGEDTCQNLPNEQVSTDAVIKMEEQFSKMAEYLIRLCDVQDDLDDDSLDSLSSSYDSYSYFSDDEWSSEDEEDSGERMRKVFVTDDTDEELELEESIGGGTIKRLANWDDDESWTALNGDWKAIMENDLKRFNNLMEQVKLASKETMEKRREAQLNSLKRILTWGDIEVDSALEDQ